MTGWFDAAMLGARIDGVEPSPLVAAAYLLSGLMLVCALRLRANRAGNRIALAGLALASGAALYSHDVVNLPEIVSALTIGGSIGLLLARRSPAASLPWLVIAGHGLLGLAAIATAWALYRNPFAFGLAGDDGIILPGNIVILAVGVATGALVVAGTLVMAIRRTCAGLALLGSGAGWSATALGLVLGNSAMVVAGALAGVAGLRLGWNARNIGPSA